MLYKVVLAFVVQKVGPTKYIKRFCGSTHYALLLNVWSKS